MSHQNRSTLSLHYSIRAWAHGCRDWFEALTHWHDRLQQVRVQSEPVQGFWRAAQLTRRTARESHTDAMDGLAEIQRRVRELRDTEYRHEARREEFIECPICRVRFNRFTRRPIVILPCGHTMCEECLERDRNEEEEEAVARNQGDTDVIEIQESCRYCRIPMTGTTYNRMVEMFVEDPVAEVNSDSD